MDASTIGTAVTVLVAIFLGVMLLRHLPEYIYKALDVFPNANKEWGYFIVLALALAAGLLLYLSDTVLPADNAQFVETVFAVGTTALIFTFHEWIRDAFAGVGLQLYNPLKIGHWITAGGQMGGITTIGLFRTEINTLGLDIVSFRNSVLLNGKIINHSTVPFYEVKTVVHTADYGAYGDDIRTYLADVETIAQQVQDKICPEAAAHDRFQAKAYFLEFGSSADAITVYSYVFAYRDGVSEMHAALSEALRPKGVVLGQVNANTFDNVMQWP